MEGRSVLLIVEMTRLTCFRRKCLLGRNLITLFQCVNTFAKIFFTPRRQASHRSRLVTAAMPPWLSRTIRCHRNASFENTAFIAAFLRQWFLHRACCTGKHRCNDASRQHLPRNKRKLLQDYTARLFQAPRKSKCANLRELFPSHGAFRTRLKLSRRSHACACEHPIQDGMSARLNLFCRPTLAQRVRHATRRRSVAGRRWRVIEGIADAICWNCHWVPRPAPMKSLRVSNSQKQTGRTWRPVRYPWQSPDQWSSSSSNSA